MENSDKFEENSAFEEELKEYEKYAEYGRYAAFKEQGEYVLLAGAEERLRAFFEKLGLDTEDAEVLALLAACVLALGEASDADDTVLANLFARTATFTLPLFFDLMGINYFPSATADDVIAYVSKAPFPPSFTEFDAAAGSYCPTASYTIEGSEVLLSRAEPFTAEVLLGLSTFIKNYLPACSTVRETGGGITFEEFDDLGLTWRVLDAAALPFSLIDTLIEGR